MKKARYIATVVVIFLIIGATSAAYIFVADKESSSWERRPLQQFPELSWSELQSGSFMKEFESYLCDQFPLRDSFRRLKAKTQFNIFLQKDNNGVYIAQGHASKLDAVMNEKLVDGFGDKIKKLYDMYLKDTSCRAYYSIIPDKNYYLAQSNGYPTMDYTDLYNRVNSHLSYMTKIDVTDLLSVDDYYTTDTHWRQESITDVADKIREAMGMLSVSSYEEKSIGDFYGVYYGQSALDLPCDEIRYLTNSEIEGCITYNHDPMAKEKESTVYDKNKLDSNDRYDFYLSGATPLIEIKNPAGEKGRELVVFRDSFGSSLTPLLLSGYAKITLVDTRYMNPDSIGDYITFDRQDVLFVYSTMIVNSSNTLR